MDWEKVSSDSLDQYWREWGFSLLLLVVSFALVSCSTTPDWEVGLASVEITPKDSMWMGGFAARDKPSEGVEMPLFAKALVIRDSDGHRVILVMAEMLGFSDKMASRVAAMVEERFGVARDEIVFSATHTHSGPFIKRARPGAWQLEPEVQERVDEYAERLTVLVAETIGAALSESRPAKLFYGKTSAGFAGNRRVVTEEGVHFGVSPEGPVDHTVPVLKVTDTNGELVAVVFGYACHNTTLGPDNYRFHGDFAGEAQAWLEKKHPGTQAMFLTGCGADINPNPRGGMENVRNHGETLATAVEQVIAGKQAPVTGCLRTRLTRFLLKLAKPPGREELLQRLESDNIYVQRHAAEMLKILDREGALMASYPYPLQVVQFGRDLTLVALAGEVVVDYSLRLTRELAPRNVWIAGYCNDVFAYIPSRRVIGEGGYEADSSMMFYGFPGPWDEAVEETIVAQVHELIGRIEGGLE